MSELIVGIEGIIIGFIFGAIVGCRLSELGKLTTVWEKEDDKAN